MRRLDIPVPKLPRCYFQRSQRRLPSLTSSISTPRLRSQFSNLVFQDAKDRRRTDRTTTFDEAGGLQAKVKSNGSRGTLGRIRRSYEGKVKRLGIR